MDEKEKSEYQKITEENKDLYESFKKQHPEWDHEQIFTGVIEDASTKESFWAKIKKLFK